MTLPAVFVVMGVSGSGKTTIAGLLAEQLGWEFKDADDFHSPENVAKMRGGTALTDEDRWPWLRSVAAWIDATRDGGHGALACPALKRAHRDILIGDRADVRLVYLRGSRELIARRQAARTGHYMPASLMDSQFDILQEPGPDETPVVVSVEPAPPQIVQDILGAVA